MKKPLKAVTFKGFAGAPAGARTPDTRLKRAVLYLLSYWGRYETGTAGLEPTMTESKSGVLPLTLHPIIVPAQTVGENQRVGYGARTHDTRNHNPVLYQLS